MNWLKKLIAQLKDDVEQVSSEHNDAEKPDERRIHTKVAYQYPEGKFRFPLIPDEKKQERQATPPRTQKNRTNTPGIQLEQMEKQKSEPVKAERAQKPKPVPKKIDADHFKKKEPFQPTEVVSPIYGYYPRPAPKREEIPEIELISKETTESMDVFFSDSEHAAALDPIIDSESEKIQAFSDTLIKEKEGILSEDRQDIEEKDRNHSHQPTYRDGHSKENNLFDDTQAMNPETVVLEEEKHPFDSRSEKMETLVDVSEQEYMDNKGKVPEHSRQKEQTNQPIKQTSERSRNKDSKKQTIPYNVIMLKQDRRSIEKRNRPDYYAKPPITLLNIPPPYSENDREWVESQRQLLDETLHHFRVGAKVVKATQGPSVTQFEVQPDPGVKVNKITNLSDDIKLSLSARDIRIEAPIPGKNTIGIEVPNRVSKPVLIREIIRHPSFVQNVSPLTVALGLDISGMPVVLDLQKMPHGLIAGATGSGKSVCVNSIIISLLYKSNPDEVKLLLIDPKMVELTPYNHIPHLVSPVITDVKAATAALKWAVNEMERRYELFVHSGVRDISRYNESARKHNQETLPYMVIIIDELADLMMVAPSDVEEAICRIAQKARACGMHLLIATQRPSVDVITGLIKANIPTRIAFSVSSQVDSRTIIDIGGAERLLGKGDMLLLENGAPKPVRVQGNFVSDEEIEKTVSHVRNEQKPKYLFEQSELLKDNSFQEVDELFVEACQFVIDQNGASTSSLQRRFRIGYNRAARLMEMLEEQGIISGPKGSKPRDVLISEEELMNRQDSDF